MDKKLLLLLLRSRRSTNQGLSLLEVLVATMVVFFTLMGALQGMLYAAIFQVKAERQAQASFWIQQDLEQVKASAATYTDTSGCSGSTIATNFNSSANMPAVIGSNTTPIQNPKKLLGKDYRLARIPTPSDNILRLEYRVGENYVPGSGQTDADSDLIADDTPQKTSIVATLYTEVIPAAALSCP
ncbi:MAG: hypothetical protein VKJ02_13960 [Snowella sp.]|nr:hypothetical protein [Snowella sp.]